MSFNMDPQALSGLVDTVDEGMLYGVNANTASIDERAFTMWEHVCEQHGTSPLRTSADARDYPERNSHLLAVLMLYASAICKPRTPGRQCIKPRSAMAYPLAILRIFNRWGIPLPGLKAIKGALAHLSRMYLAYHGPHSLAPRRAEAMKYSMVLAIDAIAAAGA